MPGFVTPSGLFVVAGGVMVALPATGERLTEWAAGPLPCRHCGEVGGCGCDEWMEAMEGIMSKEAQALAAILADVRGDRIVMTVQVVSTEAGRQYTLNGYRADSQENALPYDERIRFQPGDLTAACAVAGWGMADPPAKMPGLNHRYILRRGAEMLHSAAETPWQDRERREREKRMAEIAALDAGETGDILAALPAELQRDILNNAGLGR